MSGNSVQEQLGDNAIEVLEYYPDVTAPKLDSFSLDLTSETLTLSFSETVSAASLMPNLLTLQTGACATGEDAVSLTGGSVESTDGPVIVLKLVTADLNNVKKARNLATEETNAWVSLGASAIMDTALVPNAISKLPSCDAIKATAFVGDHTAPLLVAFKLNMATSKIELVFSETVDLLTFDESELVLYDGSGLEYRLTSTADSARSAATNRIVDITAYDLNRIKLMDSIGKTAGESFVGFSELLVSDMSGNRVSLDFDEGSGLGDHFASTFFISDNVPPTLDDATLDLTEEFLTLTFSEAVRLTDLDMTKLTVHGSLGLAEPQVLLSTLISEATISEDGTTITVLLSDTDLNELKLNANLATSVSSTRLSATASLIKDMQGNSVSPIAAAGNDLGVSDFKEDLKQPTLKQFAINMTAGTITLTFSEAVSSESVVVTGLRLQDNKRAFVSSQAGNATPDYAYTLTDGEVISSDGTVLVVQLVVCDVNHLKRLAQVATQLSDTYLTIAANSVQDLNGVPIVPIEDGAALQTSAFAKDAIKPTIEEWEVKMSEFGPPLRLLIKFSETVNVKTFRPTDITIQDAVGAADAENKIQLTGGDVHAVAMDQCAE
jgi:hypothetical protein